MLGGNMVLKYFICVVIVSLVTGSVRAQSCDVELKEQLNNCDAAYQSQKVLIKDQKEQLDNYFKKDVLQHQIINDQEKKLDSPFRDPVKMTAIAVVGILVLEIALGVFKK